jgi:alpha-amylase
MPAVVLYFHVHQPYRIRPFHFFDIGQQHDYFHQDQEERLDNKKLFHKVAQKCYFPTNRIFLDLLEKHPELKLSFSISGVFLEQLVEYEPQLLQSFVDLVETGRVELVSETHYHSLASISSEKEFKKQVKLHQQALRTLFGYKPTSFRNTELIYNNHIATLAADMGYTTILAEGVERYLGWRSPNFIYRPIDEPRIKLLLKNYKLSDDIAFRFSSRDWDEWPLSAETFASWIAGHNGSGDVVNLFMDYETFGEHQWADSGIFDFLQKLPQAILQEKDMTFMTVSEATSQFPVRDSVDMPELTSWADVERDLSAWLSNPMQEQALKSVFELESSVQQTDDPLIIQDWRRLTTSDHFYYMCTKWFADGDVHKYFSPNTTPFEAYTHYMNVLHDLKLRVYAHNRKD